MQGGFYYQENFLQTYMLASNPRKATYPVRVGNIKFLSNQWRYNKEQIDASFSWLDQVNSKSQLIFGSFTRKRLMDV